MHFDPRLRVLLDERADAPRLCARQELADDAAGRQKHRVFGTGVVDGGPVISDVEARPSVGKVERPGALGDGVVAAVFEQPRRARMIGDLFTGPRILAVAGPEDAHLTLDSFPGDA